MWKFDPVRREKATFREADFTGTGAQTNRELVRTRISITQRCHRGTPQAIPTVTRIYWRQCNAGPCGAHQGGEDVRDRAKHSVGFRCPVSRECDSAFRKVHLAKHAILHPISTHHLCRCQPRTASAASRSHLEPNPTT